MAEILTYSGKFLESKNTDLNLDAYHPDDTLVEAVNLAILLSRPLLLMGEPGCGKTRLAEAVAAELHKEKWQNHYFRWDIKSSSKAKDGIYQYDALRRLYDANSKNDDVIDINNYIKLGPLAMALTSAQNGDLPNILLIDEIDKADIDFPNDLLLEIEKGQYFIPELNKQYDKKSDVLVFITSNRERELPPAFLRRCLYHYISFPEENDLKRIISAKYEREDDDLIVSNAIKLFLELRAKIDNQFVETEKKPSTSELVEWFTVIDYFYKIKSFKKLSEREQSFLTAIENYQEGRLNSTVIPFKQVLLKTLESNQLFENATRK